VTEVAVHSRRRKLRVVYLGHSAMLSGAELGLIDLLIAFDDIEPCVILSEDGPVVERFRDLGIAVEVLPLTDGARLVRRRELSSVSPDLVRAAVLTTGYALKLGLRVRRIQPDLVVTGTLKAFVYGSLAARIASKPLIWHVHDRISDEYLPPAAVRLLRGAARFSASGVIANSQSTLRTLGNVGVPVTVIHEPVSAPRRQRAGRRDGPFTVAMVGRIAPWKGQDVFLRAFARGFPQGDERAVLIGSPLFGEDDFLRVIEGLIAKLGLEDRVELRGFCDDVQAELATVDALVHASVIPEPFGRVIVEGMAAGLPVVAAAAGGPVEIITDGVDGLLCAPGDVEGLALALRRIAEDSRLADELGRAAGERAAAFSPESAASATHAFYLEVLKGRRAAA
jgi:glycosyltransferase involved in cell wall biosynthesis